jgi:hypothetical protein
MSEVASVGIGTDHGRLRPDPGGKVMSDVASVGIGTDHGRLHLQEEQS